MRLPLLISSITLIILSSCTPANLIEPSTIATTVGRLGWALLNKSDTFMKDKVSLERLIRDVSSQINQLEETMRISEVTVINEIKRFINYHQKMTSFIEKGSHIDTLFKQFQRYTTGIQFEDDTLRNFAQACIAHDAHQLPSVLNAIYLLVKPDIDDSLGLFALLIENRETKDDAAKVCNNTISLQQQVFSLYNIIALYMVKGHVMKLYSYEILKKLSTSQYVNEIAATKTDYQTLMLDIEKTAREVMSKASRDLRPCDPRVHTEGQTYLQLQWLFNTIAVNEIFLNSGKSCWNTCPDYQTSVSIYPNNWSSGVSRCEGSLYSCFYGNVLHYCPPTKPYRRYDGFLGATVVFGKDIPNRGDTSCKRTLPVMGSVRPKTSIFEDCDDCVCYCDDYNYKETLRTFSLRTARSNSRYGRIITGIRLVEKKRVIHLQIQQGLLEANGTVNKQDVRWVQVEDFDYRSSSTSTDDYFTVTMNKKKVNFDTVSLPAGRVLTGIRFAHKDNGLTLVIEGSKFDYTSGNVDEFDRTWISSDQVHNVEISMDNSHIPTYGSKENVVDTRDNTYLNFRQTDWVKDAAQTPIPFIDIQPVVAEPPSPLSGAGIFYKGQAGYGGFIGMKLVAYDYREFITSERL